MTIGIGIIGAGRMGELHSETIGKIKDAKVVAVADSFPEKTTAFGQKYSIPSFTDYHQLLEHKDVHAIICCLPHTLHHDCVVAAANAKKHILCEKPIETTYEKMDSMLDACKKNKILFMPGHTHRFLPPNVKVRELIQQGAIGQPIMLHDRIWALGFQKGYPMWMGQKSLAGGGMLMNNGVHSIDRIRFWTSAEIINVSAKCGRYAMDIDVEDNGMMFTTLSNGSFATSELSSSTPKPATSSICQIVGSEGIIELMTWKPSIRLITRKDSNWTDIPSPEGNGFLNEMNEFINAILEQRPASVTPHDGRAAVAAILAAYESNQSNQSISPH